MHTGGMRGRGRRLAMAAVVLAVSVGIGAHQVRTPARAGVMRPFAGAGVLPFGDAPFLGSPQDRVLAAPITTMAAAPGGLGYWVAGADGAVFAYGAAADYGSAADVVLAAPIIALAAHGAGGYWELGMDGGIFSYGDAPFL